MTDDPIVDTETGRSYQPCPADRNGDAFSAECLKRHAGDLYARAWARIQATLPRHSVERANLKSSVFGLGYDLCATGAKDVPMTVSSLLSPTTSPLLRHVLLVGATRLPTAPEAPMVASTLNVGDKLTITHDVTNIHDHLAAPVFKDGAQVGWLSREVSPAIAFAVAAGFTIEGIVNRAGGSSGVYIDVYAVAPSKKGRKLGKRGKKGKKPGRKPGKKAGKKPGRKPGKKLGRPPGKKLGRPPGKKTVAPAAK